MPSGYFRTTLPSMPHYQPRWSDRQELFEDTLELQFLIFLFLILSNFFNKHTAGTANLPENITNVIVPDALCHNKRH